jgi:hypothetical protein
LAQLLFTPLYRLNQVIRQIVDRLHKDDIHNEDISEFNFKPIENELTLPNLDYNQSGVRRIIFTGIIGEEQCGFSMTVNLIYHNPQNSIMR